MTDHRKYIAIIACFCFCGAAVSVASGNDSDTIEPLIYSDMERGDRKKRIVDSEISKDITQRYIKNALQSQGRIHWDEPVFSSLEENLENGTNLRVQHIEYLIEDYNGKGCDIEFSRQLVIREDSFTIEGVNVTVGNAETSVRTVRFNAAKVERVLVGVRNATISEVHPEVEDKKPRREFVVQEIIVHGEIDIDGRPATEIALYVSMSEIADGISFADELETWLFHLVNMCHYPAQKSII